MLWEHKPVNSLVKEMVLRYGFNKRLGPLYMMDPEIYMHISDYQTRAISKMSTELSRIAFMECRELIEAAEAKAFYGVAMNFPALKALVDKLVEVESLSGGEVAAIVKRCNVHYFCDQFIEGYGWTQDGHLTYPERDARKRGRDGSEPASRTQMLMAAGGADGDGDGGLTPLWDSADSYSTDVDPSEMLRDQLQNLY